MHRHFGHLRWYGFAGHVEQRHKRGVVLYAIEWMDSRSLGMKWSLAVCCPWYVVAYWKGRALFRVGKQSYSQVPE